MKIVIFGGSGFIGRHLAAEIAKRGEHTVIIPARNRERVKNNLILLPNTSVISYHGNSTENLSAILKNTDIVVNLIGILNESKNNLFDQVHIEWVRKIIELSTQYRVGRLIHISALGANISTTSKYLKTKANGDYLVTTTANLNPTIIRPSVICGPDDKFINDLSKFIKMASIAPRFMPLPAAYTALQPMVVQDLVNIIANVIDDSTLSNKEFNVGGPQAMTLHEIVQKIIDAMGASCRIMPLNKKMSWAMATMCDLTPSCTLFTKDNYHSCDDSLSFSNDAEHLLPTLQTIDSVLYHRFGEKNNLTSKLRLDSGR